MMTLNAKFALPAVLLACVAGSCSSIKITDNTVRLAKDDRIRLTSVTFDYAKWKNQDAEFIGKMKSEEARWRELITTHFDKQVVASGLAGGTGAEIFVKFSIIDLDPGSQAMRYFIGFGAGRGAVRAMVDAGSKGSLIASGSISVGVFGGSFDGVLKSLAVHAVKAITEKRQ
jgi:hypothetical protein